MPRLDTTDRVDRYGGSTSTTAASYCIAVTLLSGQRCEIGQRLDVSAQGSGNMFSGSATHPHMARPRFGTSPHSCQAL